MATLSYLTVKAVCVLNYVVEIKHHFHAQCLGSNLGVHFVGVAVVVNSVQRLNPMARFATVGASDRGAILIENDARLHQLFETVTQIAGVHALGQIQEI